MADAKLHRLTDISWIHPGDADCNLERLSTFLTGMHGSYVICRSDATDIFLHKYCNLEDDSPLYEKPVETVQYWSDVVTELSTNCQKGSLKIISKLSKVLIIYAHYYSKKAGSVQQRRRKKIKHKTVAKINIITITTNKLQWLMENAE